LDFIWDTEVKGFGLIITPAGSKSFILNYRNQDNRSRRKTIGKYGHVTVEQAREIAKELCYRISKGDDPVHQDEMQRKQLRFSEVAKKFMEEHSAGRNRPATHQSNRQVLDGLLLPYFGKMKIRSIERRDVADFLSQNKARPIGANRSLSTMSSIMSKAELWGYRDRNTNPCFKAERYPENKRERFLSTEEFAALDAAMQKAERNLSESPHIMAMIRIMMHTGCRPSEARYLKWEYVDLENKIFRLPKEATKEKRAKTLFITPYLEEVLRGLKRMAGNPYVIVSERNDGRAIADVKKPWHRIKRAAGITSELHLHDLRHSHASMANALGYSLPMIGALLGHTQAQTTLRYAHLATDHLRKAADDISNHIAASTPKLPEPPAPHTGMPMLRMVKSFIYNFFTLRPLTFTSPLQQTS
jgi:integrase